MMNSSARLYERLGQIPQDPEDPECLDDVVVCAFGAFERYYLCWRNKAGDYRQDGYDLQPALQRWLYPTDGTQRDFESLQVVFGRGDEYFALDKFGKLEYKEPEPKAPLPADLDGKPVMRRARTSVSFLRPLPTAGTKHQAAAAVANPSPSRRSSAASEQSTSRPLSMSFSSRSRSDSSLSSLSFSRPPSESSLISQSVYSTATTILSSLSSEVDTSLADSAAEQTNHGASNASPISNSPRPRSTGKLRPLSMSLRSGLFPRISEGNKLQLSDSPPPPVQPLLLPASLVPTPSIPIQAPFVQNASAQIGHQPLNHCTCGYHPPSKPKYKDASVQTSPLPSPPRTALHLDTSTATTSMASPQSYSSIESTQDIPTPQDIYYDKPTSDGPFFMGTMMSYFSKPGYQLGDSLMNSYPVYQQPVYEYQEESRELTS